MDKLKKQKYEQNAECNTVELYHDDFIEDLETDRMNPGWEDMLRQMDIDIDDFDSIESIEIKIDTVKINNKE
jgi:hypothetical protein